MPDLAVTILNSANTSDSVDLQGYTAVGFFVPNTFDGGNLSVQTSLDGGTFVDCENGLGNVYSVVVDTPPCYVACDPTKTVGLRYLKLVSNTNQSSGDARINVVVRQV